MQKYTKRLIPLFIIRSTLISFFSCYMLLAIVLDSQEETDEIPAFLLFLVPSIFIAILLLSTIYAITYYKRSGYEISDKIVSKRGVILVQDSHLEFSKINTIKKTTSLLQRILGMTTLHVNSGSANTGFTSEIIIYTTKSKADELEMVINSKKEGIIPSNETEAQPTSNKKVLDYTYTFKTALLETFVKTIFFIILIVILNIVLLILDLYHIAILVASVCVYLLVFLFVSILTYIRYYNYKVEIEGNQVIITYGLLQKNENKFEIQKIRALNIVESIFDRLFSHATLVIDVVGFTNAGSKDTMSAGYLFPYVSERKINSLLNEISPTLVSNGEKNNAKSFKALIAIPSIIATLIALFTLAYTSVIILALDYINYLLYALLIELGLYLLIEVALLINANLMYKNQGITFNEETIVIHSGGLIKKDTIVYIKNIIGIETITTHHRLMKKIKSYRIHYYSNITANTTTVHILDEVFEQQLLSIIKF